MALEKVEGISAAYVHDTITVYLASKELFNKEKLNEALKPFKLTIEEVKLIEGNPFS